MKRFICILLIAGILPQSAVADVIVTRQNKKHEGKILKQVKKGNAVGLVIKTVQGDAFIIPIKNIAKIYQGNKVLDLDTGLSYYLEKRRPFLPFMVLGFVSAGYSVSRFQEYNRIHKKAENELADVSANEGTVNTKDSSTPLAIGIVSGLFSLGSFYVALMPMEVRVPIGKLKLSTGTNNVTLALHF